MNKKYQKYLLNLKDNGMNIKNKYKKILLVFFSLSTITLTLELSANDTGVAQESKYQKHDESNIIIPLPLSIFIAEDKALSRPVSFINSHSKVIVDKAYFIQSNKSNKGLFSDEEGALFEIAPNDLKNVLDYKNLQSIKVVPFNEELIKKSKHTNKRRQSYEIIF